MPAGSERTPVALPHTFRPLGVRLAVVGFGGMLLVLCAVVWLAFPASTRAEFDLTQRATMLAIAVGFGAAGYALARSRVVARVDGLKVVNGYRVRRYDWNEVLGVTLRRGSPWAVLDLSDGTSVAAMGIQGSDGARARTHVRQLRVLLDQQSRTDRND